MVVSARLRLVGANLIATGMLIVCEENAHNIR
jgi:hypothetical protein